jgi:hypothetical protein
MFTQRRNQSAMNAVIADDGEERSLDLGKRDNDLHGARSATANARAATRGTTVVSFMVDLIVPTSANYNECEENEGKCRADTGTAEQLVFPVT